MTRPVVVWDPRMLGYHHPGGHPMDPLRWVLTWLLAGSLGVVDGFEVVAPGPADVETLGMVARSPAHPGRLGFLALCEQPTNGAPAGQVIDAAQRE